MVGNECRGRPGTCKDEVEALGTGCSLFCNAVSLRCGNFVQRKIYVLDICTEKEQEGQEQNLKSPSAFVSGKHKTKLCCFLSGVFLELKMVGLN